MRVCAVKGTKCAPSTAAVVGAAAARQLDDAAALGRFVGQRGQQRGARQAVAATRRAPGRKALAWRLPCVMVPVLSSSSTSTSPAASTARPEVAITLACIMRLMPATPTADSRPPMVVGIRHTSSATSAVSDTTVPAPAALDAEHRERQQRDRDHQEHERQRHQQDGQRDLVGRLLALGRLDHADHAVEEGLARVHRDAHHQPVRQHARAAGHGREVAARLAHHRRRFAGDGALVDRGHAFDDFAVERDHVAGFDQHHVALAQVRAPARAAKPGRRGAARFSFLAQVSLRRPRSDAACALLRPSASASAKLANSTVNHSQTEIGQHEGRRHAGVAREAQRMHPQQRGQDAADVDDEHHRVAPLHARAQLGEGAPQRGLDQRRVEQRERGFVVVEVMVRSSLPEHQVLDHRAQRQRRHVVEQARPAARCRSAATTNSGPCVGIVPP